MDFRRLDSAKDPLFADAFALYEISFPLHEQRLPEKQTSVMSNSLYHFDVITEGGEFAGILLYWEISNCTYIEHFAVHPSMRGKSLGSKILKAFCQNHQVVILEIDPPVNEVSIRRERFYQRLGFTRNDYEHAHPAYRKEFPPHELVVMSAPDRMTEAAYQQFRRELSEIVMKDSL